MLRDCIATWECNDCTGARLAPTCTHVHTRRSWECADPYQHGKRSLTSLRRPPPRPADAFPHLRQTARGLRREGGVEKSIDPPHRIDRDHNRSNRFRKLVSTRLVAHRRVISKKERIGIGIKNFELLRREGL